MPTIIKVGALVTAALGEFAGTVYGCVTVTGTGPQLAVFFGGLLVMLWTVLLGAWRIGD